MVQQHKTRIMASSISSQSLYSERRADVCSTAPYSWAVTTTRTDGEKAVSKADTTGSSAATLITEEMVGL